MRNPDPSERAPARWAVCRVDEAGIVQLGRQRSPDNHTGAHVRPYLRVKNVFEGRIDLDDVMTMNFDTDEFERFQLHPGDVLLNEGQSLELVGRPALYRGELPGACFTNSLIRFKARDGVLPEFACALFRWYMRSGVFRSIARWTTNIAHLGAERLAGLPFLLPTTHEQRKIVDALAEQESRLDAAEAALRSAQARLKRFRASVLQAAVTGRLVPTEAELARREGRSYEPAPKLLERVLAERRKQFETSGKRGKYVEPTAPDVARLPELPEGWCWATIDQLHWNASYGTSTKCSYEFEGPPVLRIPNVANDRLDLGSLKRAKSSGDVDGVSPLAPGDLLVIRTNGSRGLIGRAALVAEALSIPHYFASYLIRLRLCGDQVLARWVSLAWRSPWMRAPLESAAATSAGQYNLSLATLMRLPIPLPPLAEAERALDKVAQAEAVQEYTTGQVVHSAASIIRTRQATLRLAFEGRLVDPDPSDEPASALLARIRTARAQAASNGSPKPRRAARRPKTTT